MDYWNILPVIDFTGTGDGTNDQPVFRATTTCPSPTPFLIGGIVIGAAIAYLFLKK